MIKLHRLDGTQFVLNAETIETVEATPDTVIRLQNGRVYVVSDSVELVMSRCIAYKRAMFEGLLGAPLDIHPARWNGEGEAET